MDYKNLFARFKQPVSGRYITNEHIKPLLPDDAFVAGWSVEDREIFAVKTGSGPNRILIWSQMHGNESTTTKALLDFLAFLYSDDDRASYFLEQYTFFIIPILNPDGAAAYTRHNAADVDLNRDFQNLSQRESTLLHEVFKDFRPHLCFNMHDQRTIYGAGTTGKPATLSFLAPSFNENREWNDVRLHSARLIVAIEKSLRSELPGMIARYDDGFNPNCVGDSFQAAGVPTVLFEAGHYLDDYQRETTRTFIACALLTALSAHLENLEELNLFNYLDIPQNEVNFYDVVYKNVTFNYDGIKIISNFAAQFTERLRDGKIEFEAFVTAINLQENIYGHRLYDAKGEEFSSAFGKVPVVGSCADFRLGSIEFKNGLPLES